MVSRSVAGTYVYINNFIQIWCSVLFCSMPCGSNSCQMNLERHRPPFESSGKKYMWIILLGSNTNDSHSWFHSADCNFWQRWPRHAAWSECISMVCWVALYGAQSQETAIVWNERFADFWGKTPPFPKKCSNVPQNSFSEKTAFFEKLLNKRVFST